MRGFLEIMFLGQVLLTFANECLFLDTTGCSPISEDNIQFLTNFLPCFKSENR